jgi:hypothetical protein
MIRFLAATILIAASPVVSTGQAIVQNHDVRQITRTAGTIPVGNGSRFVGLDIGSDGQALVASGGEVAWGAPSVDWTSPGTIGSTTPSTGEFLTLRALPTGSDNAIYARADTGYGIYARSDEGMGVYALTEGETYAGHFFRNVAAATLPVVRINQTEATAGGPSLTVNQDGTGDLLQLTEDGADRVIVDCDGNLEAVAIDNTPIGSTTPSTGAFTTLAATGVVGIGGSAVSGYPITAYQSADSQGIKLFGYDDRSTEYFHAYVKSAGGSAILASGSLWIGADAGYTNLASSGGQSVYLDSGDQFVLRDCDAANTIRLTIDSAASPATGRLIIPEDSTNAIVLGAGNDLTLGYDGTEGQVDCAGGLQINDDTEVIGTATADDFELDGTGHFSTNTVDGSDTAAVYVCGGGSHGSGRGAYVYLYGEEKTGNEGMLYISAGDSGNVDVANGNLLLSSDTQQIGLGASGVSDMAISYDGSQGVIDCTGGLQVNDPLVERPIGH